MIYPEIGPLIKEILKKGKHVYLCTNGVLLEEKLELFNTLAASRGLGEKILKRRLYWNVHLDGPEKIHDAVVERPGTYQKAIHAIRAAKKCGYRVYTNTTLYKQTQIEDLVEFAKTLTELQIDGIMLAPGYGYESVENDSIFLRREEIHQKFREIREKMSRFRITTTPIFMDFLCGERSLDCAAYANPTRNIAGWKGPCYLMTDRHFDSYEELLRETDWTKIGFGNDPRCEHCLSHCGFEPAAVFACRSPREILRITRWEFS